MVDFKVDAADLFQKGIVVNLQVDAADGVQNWRVIDFEADAAARSLGTLTTGAISFMAVPV